MSQWFYIHSKLNGLVLDVWKEHTSAGSKISVFKKHGGPNQMFCYDASTRTIRCKMNLYCLDATNNGRSIVINPFRDNVCRWAFEDDYIRELNSGLVLDIAKSCRNSGAQLILYRCTGNVNQQWGVEYVG